MYCNVYNHTKQGNKLHLWAAFLLLSLVSIQASAINTKTATTTGNWSSSSIWSPAGVPSDTDNIIINSGITVTVDGNYTCRDLDVGNNSSSNSTLKIITAGNSLTVTGDLDFNAFNRGATYIIDAGPGTFNFNGTFSNWATSGTNKFQIGTGAINFAAAVSITDPSHDIVFTGAGAVTFNSNFADNENGVTYYTGCTLNFHGNYAVSTNAVDWTSKGTANFYGTGSITPNKNIKMNTVNVMSSANTTLGFTGSGALTVEGSLTVNSSANFTMNDNFQLNGNFTNNGTLTAGSVTLTMKGSGTTQVIGGSSALSLPTLQVGSGNGADINVSITQNTTVAALTFSAGDNNRTVTIGSGKTLTVTGDATLAQPTKDNKEALISVGSGTLTVSGNLVFTGTNNGTKRVARIAVTSGTFNLTGGITWMNNSAVATEVIAVSTGTVNFNSSVTMGTKSGTISLTGSGNVNFNGTSAPSLTFGGSTAPVLTAAYGGTISFVKGLTTNTTALTFVAGSNVSFTGNGTITPNASLTFANFSIASSQTVTAAGNFSVSGNWNNNGTFTPSTYTVTFNGTGTKSITRSGGETFYKMTVSQSGATVKLNNDVMVTNTLTMSGSNLNLNGNTITLGNSTAATLSRSAGIAYGGTFKRWIPSGTAITSNSGSFYGLFPIGTISQYRPIFINSTSNATTSGYVMATHTDGSGGVVVTYTDNEGSNIEQITNQKSTITTSGLAGGTYTMEVKYSQLGSAGSVANLKLVTYTGNTMGSCGTHSATLGSVSAPTGKRTGLTAANLSNVWVMGTNDRNATPLYTYVYSRKSGNWNDNSATGTWSYTAGGSGAACSCLPTSGGYAVIESGHAVTVTATDTVQFLDIESTGSLTINATKTFTVTGNMDMFGSATFTNNGTLNVTGELLFSPSTSQTFSGNVTVSGWFTLDSGATYNHSSGTLTITGDLQIDGAMSLSSGATMAFSGTNAVLSGTGTFTTSSGGVLSITNDKTIDEGTALTIGTSSVNTNINLAANTTINNLGSISLNGSITGTNATSTWVNNANATLELTGALLSTGTLDVVTSPNIVHYNGSGSQNIKVPAESYHTLMLSNTGTKSLIGNVPVDSAVSIGGSVVLEEGTYILFGNANLSMSGTSELKLTRTTDEDVYPELRGTYNLTGGTVTITQNGDSGVINDGPYYNLKINGTHGSDLGAISTITNNLDVLNTAFINNNSILTVGNMLTYNSTASTTLNDSVATGGITLSTGTINSGGYSINVKGSGGWTKASAATFTPSTGTVYFTGTSAQTLGGTSTSQTFNSLCVNKPSGTVTVGGSTTALNIGGDMILNAGVLDKGTAVDINMTGGNWENNGGSFTPGNGTVTFNSTTIDQAIQGLSSSTTFNNVTVNKTGYTLAVGGSMNVLNLSGNMTLTAGTLNAGTAADINMTAGNWTNNSATFTPGSSRVTFSGSSAQAINGTATSQTFNKLTVNKNNSTLSVSGSTTSLTLNSDMTLTSGTFNKNTANDIYVAGNWTNNGGTFTYGTGKVHFNGTTAQYINGTAATQEFYKLNVNKSLEDLTISGSTGTVLVIDSVLLNGGRIITGTNKLAISSTGTVTGANSSKYIYGNEEIYIPNTLTPSRTFNVGDGSSYAPVVVDFSGTTSGSGSIIACTSGSDDADITNSGVDPTKSVNRTWTLTNSSVAGFTSYSATYNFAPGDRDAGTTPANFEVRRYTGGTWYAATAGSRTASSTQATSETGFGRIQVGEKATITVATHPADTTNCSGTAVTFTSTSSSTPAPTVKWQRDPNTGTFTDITGAMDGGVYSNYTSTTLSISNIAGLGSYKYRAVFTNINGNVTSNQATLTVTPSPTITGTTPASRCSTGTVDLGATASAGTINWYAASSGGSSLGTGTTFTTPSISSTTTYYVDATNNGCTSTSRTAVIATVSNIPTITSTTPASRCGTGTVLLGATASAGTINWYAAASGGVSLGSGTSFSTPSISSSTNYYADATDGGCTTASRTAVTATINAKPVASVGYQSCAGINGSTTIRLTPSGGTGPYTFSIDSTNYSTSDTVHIMNGANHNYYVKDNNNCTSDPTNYSASAPVPTQVPASLGSTSCSCPSSNEGRDVYLTDNLGNLIAIVNDRGHDLGTITATVYTKAAPVLLTNNQGGQTAALGRNYVLDFNGTNLSPAVEVSFPFTNDELNDLITAAAATPDGNDDINTLTDLGSTQYEGPDEDSTYNTTGATMLVYHRQLSNGNILNGKYVKIALTANGEHWFHGGGSGSALPVKLVSFDAVVKPALQQVQTTWVTSLEIDNNYFTVERSTDGINFTEIGRVSGKGTTTTTNNYTFTDIKPLMGISYYRLKQTDFDGDYTYSHIVAVSMTEDGALRMYPNPTDNQVHIAVSNPGSFVHVAIHDMNGRTIFENNYTGNNGDDQIVTLELKDFLASGIYLVNVTTNGTSFKQKLTIK